MFTEPIDSLDPTDKQQEILRIVFRHADAGSFVTFKELREELSYKPKKSALSCSLKILRDWGAIELVYGPDESLVFNGRPGFIRPTPAAYKRFRFSL